PYTTLFRSLTNSVARGAPFQRTSEAGMKLLPSTVRAKAGLPGAMLLGASALTTGTGLGAMIVKGCALEIPPPGAGVATVTCAVPAVAMSAAEMAAVSCVALTNVVVRAAPFQRTSEAATKPLPVTVTVKAAPPTVALAGATVESVGTGALVMNVRAADVPPPGAGLNTVTEAVPGVATSTAGMAAVSCVALTNVVVRGAPFQRTSEPVTKLLPVTVRVKAAPPAVALAGASPLTTGTGLAAIVNVWALEVPPPGSGVKTVTEAVPTAARSAAGMAAVSCVPLTNVVVRAVPFQRTSEVATKFVPVTVSVKSVPPAAALLGVRVESVGTGALMVIVSAPDVPPPGVG